MSYTLTIPTTGCQSITIPLNLSGDYIVSTTVKKEPSLLTPWNVSIVYDEILYASLNVNTQDSDDVYNFLGVPAHDLKEIVIWFCNSQGYYLTQDSLDVVITVTNETGGIVFQNEYVINVNVYPVYPVPINVFIGLQTSYSTYQEIAVYYTPVTLNFTIYYDVFVGFELTLTLCSKTYTINSGGIVFPGGPQCTPTTCTYCVSGFCYSITTQNNSQKITFSITLDQPCFSTIEYAFKITFLAIENDSITVDVSFSPP